MPSCRTCQDAATCLTCKNSEITSCSCTQGQYVHPVSKQCVDAYECPQGTHTDPTSQVSWCYECGANCVECLSNRACKTCAENYVQLNGQCLNCLEHCQYYKPCADLGYFHQGAQCRRCDGCTPGKCDQRDECSQC